MFWDLYEQTLKGPEASPKKEEPFVEVPTTPQLKSKVDLCQEKCEPAETDRGSLEVFAGIETRPLSLSQTCLILRSLEKSFLAF